MAQHSALEPQRLHFCIRDDDTNFFTQPEELERAYGRITQWGPVSLAVVPFCRAGTSKAVPEKLRRTWSVHPLHEKRRLSSTCAKGSPPGSSKSCSTATTTTSRTAGRSLPKATTCIAKFSTGADTLKICSPRRSESLCRLITQSGDTGFAPWPGGPSPRRSRRRSRRMASSLGRDVGAVVAASQVEKKGRIGCSLDSRSGRPPRDRWKRRDSFVHTEKQSDDVGPCIRSQWRLLCRHPLLGTGGSKSTSW